MDSEDILTTDLPMARKEGEEEEAKMWNSPLGESRDQEEEGRGDWAPSQELVDDDGEMWKVPKEVEEGGRSAGGRGLGAGRGDGRQSR